MTSTRVLTAIAVVSVILNLLLVGFFVGQKLPHFAAPWRDGPGMDREFARDLPPPPPGERRELRTRIQMRNDELNFPAAMRTLDPETRKAMQEKFRTHMPELRERVENMINKRHALLDLLAAEPVDMDRVSQALEEVREAGTAAQEHSHKLFMDIANDLQPEQRAAFMKAAATQRQPRSRNSQGNPEPRP